MASDPIEQIAASAPDHIWLDLGEEMHLVDDGTTFKDLGGVTWSEDNATGHGIKYVRATPPAATPAAPGDALTDAIRSAENILDRVALSVGTSTTAEKEREWRDAARIAIGGIRWELSRAALSHPAPVAASLSAQLATAVEAIEARHDPFCMSVLRGKECDCGKVPAAPVAAPAPASEAVAQIAIDFKQATELLEMFGGEPCEVTLRVTKDYAGPGLYAHYTEYPEEGAAFLGVTDGCATPTAGNSVDAPVQQAGEALKWCAAALQALVDSRGERGSISMFVSGEKKSLEEVLDMADAALKGEQPVEPSGSERGEV